MDQDESIGPFYKLNQTCEGGNRIVLICLNPKCKAAVLCRVPTCPQCSKPHSSCSTASLSKITDMLSRRLSGFQQFIAQVRQVDNALMATMQASKTKLTERLKLRCMEKELPAVFSHLYRPNAQFSIKGGRQLWVKFEREQERIATTAAALL
jgi:hypothetical protein